MRAPNPPGRARFQARRRRDAHAQAVAYARPRAYQRFIERDVFERAHRRHAAGRRVGRQPHGEARTGTLPVPRPRIVGFRGQQRGQLRDREVIGVLFNEHPANRGRQRGPLLRIDENAPHHRVDALHLLERPSQPRRRGNGVGVGRDQHGIGDPRGAQARAGRVHRGPARRADVRDVRRQRFLRHVDHAVRVTACRGAHHVGRRVGAIVRVDEDVEAAGGERSSIEIALAGERLQRPRDPVGFVARGDHDGRYAFRTRVRQASERIEPGDHRRRSRSSR